MSGFSSRATTFSLSVTLACLALFAPVAAVATPDGVVTRRAVVVGIADYAGTAYDLKYCDDDARDLVNALQRDPRWQVGSVQLLLDAQGTRANIQAALQTLAAAADEDDICLFYFSGHGTIGDDLPPYDELDGLDEYIVPSDFGYISDDELSAWLAPIRASKVFISVDTCYSGGQIKSPNAQVKSINTTGRKPARGDGLAADLQKAFTKDIADLGRFVVSTACADDELSEEWPSYANGVYTEFLLASLASLAADSSGNGQLSAEEAHAYLARLVTASNPYQHPQLYDGNGATATEFIATASQLSGSVQFKSAEYTVKEGAGLARVYLSRTGGSVGAASVIYTTLSGTALAGSDYTPTNGMLTWLDGETGDKVVEIPITVDALLETPERFTVQLTDSFSAAYGAPWSTTVIIREQSNPDADFDGDFKSDVAVYLPSLANWYILPSSGAPVRIQQWGWSATSPMPADYDCDGKADLNAYYPPLANWYILQSLYGSMRLQQWGWNATVPAPADYDGDGKADPTAFDAASDTWYIWRSTSSSMFVHSWGSSGYLPVPGDYDGDGKADLAQYRQATADWGILRSSDGLLVRSQWGWSTTLPAPADYDGDGKTDIAVYYPGTGTWYLMCSRSGIQSVQWGWADAMPVPADYDGDGKADIAVYHRGSGMWYIIQSRTRTIRAVNWGWRDTIPVLPQYNINSRFYRLP